MQPLHVFVFCNPTSGGNKAAKLLDLPNKKNSFAFEDKELKVNIQVRVFNLKADESRSEGFETLKAFKPSNAVRAVAAGGDGTVKWVISELEKVNCVDVPIGVIPFGTGNDMARILGWGATAPSPLIGGDDMAALKGIIRDICMGEPLSLDVWRVETRVDPEKGRFDVAVRGEIVERKDKAKVVIENMINYCSFGQDARAVFGFERRRRSTQFLNKVQYALEGGKLSVQPSRKLRDTELTLDESTVSSLSKNEGVIFQNIPSYAAGSDFWDASDKWTPGDSKTPQMIGDGLLEVHGLNRVFNIALHKVTLGALDATSRMGQAKKIVVKFDKSSTTPLYCQVDGEPCRLTHAESCEISPAYQVRMISRNDARLVLLQSVAAETSTQPVLMSGFLLKARKHVKNDTWNSRFVALVNREGGRLLCLEWYRGSEMRGRVVLIREGAMEAKIEKVDHGGPRPNTVFTVRTKHKSTHFAAKSEIERDTWLQSLGFSSSAVAAAETKQ